MISRKFVLTCHSAWKMNGTSCMKTPATTAPQRLKMPPISTTASRISESWIGKP